MASTLVRRAQIAAAIVFCLAPFGSASEPLVQEAFSYEALRARMPAERVHTYIVNAKVRPIPLIWIGRDNIGGARITWREGTRGGRAVELLIGSDPDRAPRRINRWGFILESLHGDNADVLGVMKESNEKTIEEAEAQTARGDVAVSTFRAARATITGSRAVGGAMTVHVPAHFTYRDLDALLASIPPVPPRVRTVDLPPGTQKGFLVALDSLIKASVDPCRGADDARTRNGRAVPYVYNQTLYDLSLLSCDYQTELRTKTGTFPYVVDGRFQLRNRTTHEKTTFRVFIGTSGDLRTLPVRAVFRPRWWLEIDMVLDRSAGEVPGNTTSHQ